MNATILKAGPQTTIQDLGREGGARLGLAPGGAMDRKAFMWANRLLGNAAAVPALEATLGGLVIEFEETTTIAVTGADCGLSIAGTPAPFWKAIRVEKGTTVRLEFARSGVRSYVAFPGGLRAPRFAGSASVVEREGLPGELGRRLESGDSISWFSPEPAKSGVVAIRFRHRPPAHLTLPIIPGYDWDRFSRDDRSTFLTATWTVGPSSDRIATTLEGAKLRSGPRVLDSVPLVDGTIQVLADGSPLVFMRDRPTIGGYPKLGSVLPEHLDLLAQARPGTPIQFEIGDASAALQETRAVQDFFRPHQAR